MIFTQYDGCYGTELARVRGMSRPGEPPFIEPWTRKAWEKEQREEKKRKALAVVGKVAVR